jgi:2'-5' RNA ligase
VVKNKLAYSRKDRRLVGEGKAKTENFNKQLSTMGKMEEKIQKEIEERLDKIEKKQKELEEKLKIIEDFDEPILIPSIWLGKPQPPSHTIYCDNQTNEDVE